MEQMYTAEQQNMMSLTDEELLYRYSSWLRSFEEARRYAGVYEQEIMRRIDERGATAIPSDLYDCSVKQANSYDQGSLRPLLEVFSESDLKTCYEPEHQETIDVAAKWNVTKAKAVARRYGKDALSIIERAIQPGRRTLIFKRRE